MTLKNTDIGDGVTWHFDGAAGRTVMFMRDVYAAGATDLIDATIAQIRGEKPSPPLDAP